MADDIDDLLDEVEDSLSRDSLGSMSTSSNKSISSIRKPKNSKSESVKTVDLKDLLDDLDEPPLSPLPASRLGGSSTLSGSSKCSSPHLAGTSVPPGMSTGVTLRACDCLRCLKCDMSVVTVDGFCWSATTDYLFLRNNYPDLSRLRARLEPQRGVRSYACQCQHRSLTEPSTVANDGKLMWVCGGHSLEDE